MGCFSKLVLFILNFIIFGAGVAVVALSSIIIHNNAIYGSLLVEKGIVSIPVIVLIVALIICTIGFLGCCGALKESSCMLKMYAVIVAVLLIAEITLGILMLVYPREVEGHIKEELEDAFQRYNQDETTSKVVDLLQSELKCCGVNNYTDWADWTGGVDVTKGCCRKDKVTDTCFKGMANQPLDVASSTIYTQGCYEALKDELKDKFIGVFVASIIIAIVQILAVVCACGLSKKTAYNYA